MGTGFSLHCNDCGKDYTISLGVGMGYPRVCEEIRSHGGGYMANFAGDGLEPVVIY